MLKCYGILKALVTSKLNYSGLHENGSQIERSWSLHAGGSIDPLGRPTITAGSDHYFRLCCLYIRFSTIQNLEKLNKIQERIMITIGGTVGPAEWIIDDMLAAVSQFFVHQIS